jgi:hypothetical protein
MKEECSDLHATKASAAEDLAESVSILAKELKGKLSK